MSTLDQCEAINWRGLGPRIDFAPGASFECLVGAHNGATSISTGLVTLAGRAQIPYHLHTFPESITLLRGQVSVEVEGRYYSLAQLDNVTIPAGRAHRTTNLSAEGGALLHIVLGTDSPTRELVAKEFPSKNMPRETTGGLYGERFTAFNHTDRHEAGKHAEFISYCDPRLMSDIEMSCGYCVMYPGGQLKRDMPNCEEAICVLQGSVDWADESRRYSLFDYSALLQWRCRPHSLSNTTDKIATFLYACTGMD